MLSRYGMDRWLCKAVVVVGCTQCWVQSNREDVSLWNEGAPPCQSSSRPCLACAHTLSAHSPPLQNRHLLAKCLLVGRSSDNSSHAGKPFTTAHHITHIWKKERCVLTTTSFSWEGREMCFQGSGAGAARTAARKRSWCRPGAAAPAPSCSACQARSMQAQYSESHPENQTQNVWIRKQAAMTIYSETSSAHCIIECKGSYDEVL